jgi:hypothetical protein
MIRKVINIVLLGALAYFSYLLLLISLQYIPFAKDAAFLRIKIREVEIPYYIFFFKIHVYTSFFVLLAGFTQFNKTIRRKLRNTHRGMGWFYVAVVLLLAAPSGLVLGWHANGGWSSQLAFVLLGILWVFCTAMALHYAIKKNWKKHRNFMIRSYALTLSAVTLRLWKWIIVAIWEPLPMDTYRIVAWLGWVLNIAIAEYIIYKKGPVKN